MRTLFITATWTTYGIAYWKQTVGKLNLLNFEFILEVRWGVAEKSIYVALLFTVASVGQLVSVLLAFNVW